MRQFLVHRDYFSAASFTTKITRYFEGYLEFFRGILHWLFIYFTVFTGSLTMLCGTLVGRHWCRRSQDSVINTVAGYVLDDPRDLLWFLIGTREFSRESLEGSGTHAACYEMPTRISFSWGKAAGSWSSPPTFIWCWGRECLGLCHSFSMCLQDIYRDNYRTKRCRTEIFFVVLLSSHK